MLTSASPRNERDGRRDLEVDDRFEADAPHRLEVAGAGDADDQRGEQQRRDDHLDHPQERVGERLHRDAKAGPEVADDDADDETDEDLRRQIEAALARNRRA